MYIPFESLPQHSRVWIYQSGKKFTQTDIDTISEALTSFTQNWSVHGQPMETSFDIRYNHFIILAANDQASGCSIDSSVRAIKEIGSAIGADLFDRTQVAFKEKEEIVLLRLAELKQKFESGLWNEQTSTFNNLVDTKAALADNWVVAAGTTWLKRYLPKETVSR
jgi:hypothetical protein